jgi:hypothetical protein
MPLGRRKKLILAIGTKPLRGVVEQLFTAPVADIADGI